MEPGERWAYRAAPHAGPVSEVEVLTMGSRRPPWVKVRFVGSSGPYPPVATPSISARQNRRSARSRKREGHNVVWGGDDQQGATSDHLDVCGVRGTCTPN